MENDSSLDGGCERSTQIDDSKSNHRTTSYQKLIQCLEKNKFPVTVILGDSTVKDVKGWKII